MFAIGEFPGPLGKKEVAIIRTEWISGKKCFWPPFWRNNTQLTSALETGCRPDPRTWSLYDVHIVGNKYYDSYTVARTKLSQAEICSELSGEEELGRLRKRNPAQHGSVHSSDDGDGGFVAPKTKQRRGRKQTVGIPLPPPPSAPQEISIPSHSLVAVEDSSSLSRDCATPINREQSRVQQNTQEPCNLPFVDPVHTYSILDSPLTVAMGTSNRITTHQPQLGAECNIQNIDFNSQVQTDFNDAFQIVNAPVSNNNLICIDKDTAKSILTNQELIMAKLDMMLDIQRTLMRRDRNDANETSTVSLPLPIADVDSFWQLERTLKANSQLRQDLVSLLATKGGNNPNQTVHRIMKALLTDEVMLQMTFAGRSGKICFRDTIFLPCICEAARRHPKGPSNDKEVENPVDYWLKKASTRITAREERENKVPPGSS